MQIAISTLLSVILTLGSVVVAYYKLPLGGGGLTVGGTSITTIQGSDTLSSSRTTINNNFTSLNDNKVEISDLAATTSLQNLSTLTGLATVGTITTGVWNGTKIDTAYGGTGSTTLSQYSVLLGSTTNPVGIVNGLGTSGQFLTSQGAGSPPIWSTSAIDQAGAYVWTNKHIWQTPLQITVDAPFRIPANTTYPFQINGNSFAFATGTVATTTIWANDGAGNVNFYSPGTMMTYWATSTYQVGGTTGNQTFTHSLGRVPKFFEITAQSRVNDASGNGFAHSFGVATSTGGNQTVTTFTTSDVGGAYVGQNKTGSIVLLRDSDGTTDAEASITSYSDSQIILNWSSNSSGNGDRHFILKIY